MPNRYLLFGIISYNVSQNSSQIYQLPSPLETSNQSKCVLWLDNLYPLSLSWFDPRPHIINFTSSHFKYLETLLDKYPLAEKYRLDTIIPRPKEGGVFLEFEKIDHGSLDAIQRDTRMESTNFVESFRRYIKDKEGRRWFNLSHINVHTVKVSQVQCDAFHFSKVEPQNEP